MMFRVALGLVAVVGACVLSASPAQAEGAEAARLRPGQIAATPALYRSPVLRRSVPETSLSRISGDVLQRPASKALPRAQWQTCDPCKRKRRWSAVIGPYGWLAGVSGSSWNNGERTDFDISFDQLKEFVSGGFMLYAEFGFDRWFVSFDGTWAVLQSDFPWKLGTVGFKQKQTILEGRVGYRLFGRPHGAPCDCQCSTCPPPLRDRFIADVYVGARYWDSETTVRVGIGPLSREITTQDDWVDGLVGVRLGFQLSPTWSVALRTDLAGFNIRDSSTLTSYAFLGFDWRFAKRWSLALGYRAMLLDRTEGSGGNRNGVRTLQQGPLFGLLFHF